MEQNRDETDQNSCLQLYILIHSMDSANLKSEDAQDYIADLAAISQIKLIVTVDNIGANRIWNEQ